MTRDQINRFLEGIARGWSISRSCKLAGIKDLNAPSNLRRVNPGFADAWRMAHEAGTDRFEDAASDRAINGTTKGVYHQGRLVAFERVYSDKLLLAVLASRRPSKWRHFDKLGEGADGQAPSVRGEDVISILEQKLAGLEARSLARALPEGTSGGTDG